MKLDNLKKRQMIIRIAEFVFIVRQQLEQTSERINKAAGSGNHIDFNDLAWEAIRVRCEADPNMKWVLDEMEGIDRYVKMREEDGFPDWYLD